MSKATATICSLGSTKAADPVVLAQLTSKFPARKETIPADILESANGPIPEFTPQLRRTFSQLRPHAGCGTDAFRNEHFKMFAHQYADDEGRKVVDYIDAHAELYVNGKLPDWVYGFYATIGVYALLKETPVEGVPLQVRPVGVSACFRRAVAKQLNEAATTPLAETMYPRQIGVRVPVGPSQLGYGLTLHLQRHPDHVVLKTDKRNAYNSIHVLRFYAHCSNIRLKRYGSSVDLCWRRISPADWVLCKATKGRKLLRLLRIKASPRVIQRECRRIVCRRIVLGATTL